ncbi:ParB/RepB/Spo0J family partition protein [Thauera phenylacetica]|uniref:ParB/RepB/Spo0J family partition protein n=1 Tax=Thauera phenylacetica TaxID=164400 RepID=UPI0039E2F09C
MTEFQETALALLAPSPTNPRKHFAELEGLAESIKAQGVMQPILTRPWPDDYPTPEGRDRRPAYEIVAGERRYRASLLAGLATIPALVRPLTTRQVLEAQIVENLQRRDVTELEEAEGYQLMMRDLALVSTLDVPTYTDDIATPAPLVTAAERAGLNVDRIRASMAGKPAAEKTAPTPPQAAPAGECSAPKFEAGQRVRIRPGACWDNGAPINADDTPGTIQGASGGDGYDVLFQNGSRRHYLPAIALELAASEGASTPEQAAPAGDDLAQPPKAKSAARAKQAAPAGDDPAQPPKAKPAAHAKQAAPARAVKTAKPKAQAATAARKAKEKAKTSGRVAAAGGKGKPTDDPPPYRCPNTPDMLEGATV